jgi:hypothetical protein
MAVYFKTEEKKTMEQVQQEVDALTHIEFMKRLAVYLSTAGTYGCAAYYCNGTQTPNGMMMRAMCNRLARINGDIEIANGFLKDFAERDKKMAKEAKEAADAAPAATMLVWIDADSFKKLNAQMSVTKALLTTYPVSGCLPLRTVSKEEMQQLADQEL